MLLDLTTLKISPVTVLVDPASKRWQHYIGIVLLLTDIILISKLCVAIKLKYRCLQKCGCFWNSGASKTWNIPWFDLTFIVTYYDTWPLVKRNPKVSKLYPLAALCYSFMRKQFAILSAAKSSKIFGFSINKVGETLSYFHNAGITSER